MADARKMGKSELFSHFADHFDGKRAKAREFSVPGMVKLVVQNRKARVGRNPATGAEITIPAKTAVKARVAKPLKDALLPKA